jgi:hypothetical protein
VLNVCIDATCKEKTRRGGGEEDSALRLHWQVLLPESFVLSRIRVRKDMRAWILDCQCRTEVARCVETTPESKRTRGQQRKKKAYIGSSVSQTISPHLDVKAHQFNQAKHLVQRQFDTEVTISCAFKMPQERTDVDPDSSHDEYVIDDF